MRPLVLVERCTLLSVREQLSEEHAGSQQAEDKQGQGICLEPQSEALVLRHHLGCTCKSSGRVIVGVHKVPFTGRA